MKITHQVARLLGWITFLATTLMVAGCASILNGGARTLSISTQPAGAKATISKADSGALVSVNTTPFKVSLEPKARYFKGQGYTIKLELPGYQPAQVAVRAELSGWYFGNIVIGGLVGMLVVDPLTGSMWNLSPEKIDQPLSASQASLIRGGKGFVVVLVAQTTVRERAAMVRIN